MDKNFLHEAHALDFLAQHQDSMVITPKGIYYINPDDIPKSIPIDQIKFNSIKHSMKNIFDKDE